MPYSAEISRQNPTLFLFLVDQSGSMDEVLDPTNMQKLDKAVQIDGKSFTHTAAGRTKAQGLADAINRLLQNLVIRCAKSEGVRDYYSISVFGYGAVVGPALGGALAGREVVPISEIGNNPIRVEERTKKEEDGAGGLLERTVKMPIWFDPVASGGTPMCDAFRRAQATLSSWLAQHPTCFPPIVINITDGESTDGDPSTAADGIKGLSSNDGNALLFNLHISAASGAGKVEFPESESALPQNQYAKLLFNMSSTLPEYMRTIAAQEGFTVTTGSRGFVFNGDLTAIIRFIDIGTRAANLR